ncbi:hypothetical protein [Ancylobacter sp. G4_0304]|uniref:hypothetical protein n=1 Tax=Ancylobacter sp. G4_0304 TaxID=3114289 RepID=UPI0039C75EB9
MSSSRRSERSLISHDEDEVVRLSHHPAIYEVETEALQGLRRRIREFHEKERTLSRHKRRVVRGKAEERGRSFPGTAERPAQRKQVFAAAMKRVNSELRRRADLESRASQAEIAHKALALRRSANFTKPPVADRTADTGMDVIPSRRRTTVPPAKIGSISQQVKNAQARRDRRA